MEEETLLRLLEAIPMASVFVSQSERVLGANELARSLLGSRIVGRHFITVLRQPMVLDAIEACLREQAARSTRYLSNDGAQDTTFNVRCSHLETQFGSGALVCFEDVTHLEQAGQMRRDFVANVSHELRTPLTALTGFIETLRGPARDDPAVRDRFLGIMEAEAGRMNRLVGDLLSLSRVEAEERQRPTGKVDLLALIVSIIHTLRPLALEAGVELQFSSDVSEALVQGDEDQLRQVFTNLIENAIKYSGAGAQVAVQIAKTGFEPSLRGPGFQASVRDTGPGIDPVHIPRLTERFYRVDTHRSREMGGTGLGLAIVKHIVGRHRGRLRIESALGQGSLFRVILPSY